MNRRNDTREFFYQVAFDFTTQLRELIEAKRMGRSTFAKLLGVSKGRVSQILNAPSNLTLETIVQSSRRLNRKVAVVLYDDGDSRNKKGPILPQVFVECWKRQGCPRNFFDLSKPAGPLRLVWNQPSAANDEQFPEPVVLGPETASTNTANLGITNPFAIAR